MQVRGLLSQLVVAFNRDNNPVIYIYFKTTGLAMRFFDCFHKTKVHRHTTHRFVVCPADLQGFDANARRFKSARRSRQLAHQPILFRTLKAETNTNRLLAMRSVATSTWTDWIDLMAKSAVTAAIALTQQTPLGQVSSIQPVRTQTDNAVIMSDDGDTARTFDAQCNTGHCGFAFIGTSSMDMHLVDCTHCGLQKRKDDRFCTLCGGACS